MKKLTAVVAAVAAATLTVGIADIPSAQGAGRASQRASAPAAYTPPAINWRTCSDATLQKNGAKCGTLIVPLDYAHPRGSTIKLAVSRVLHTTTKASDYKGVMLVNPGGPGGSGLIYSIFQTFVPKNAGAGYDWIGFDPRGVGSSSPSLTCDSKYFHGNRPQYTPSTAAIMRHWVARSKNYAAECTHAKGHALFGHVKTTDTVADMESLRIALGQRKINFYGFSYGTYLGQVYATLHPSRVGRFVLDSTVDPNRVFYKSNQDQDVAFQKTFNIYFRWLAKYWRTYHVGHTEVQVRARYLSVLKALDKHAAKGFLGGDELIDVFTSAGYYVYGWEDIASAYSKYVLTGNPDALIQMYKAANPTTAGGDNGYAMYLGTQCTDAPWPRSQAQLNRDNAALNKKYYYFTWSNAWFNGPCAYWHYRASRPVKVTGRHVHTPILMIDETYDAATPFHGSLVVRNLFPTASLIEGRNGTTHAGTLSGVACTDNSIADYLLTGAVPARRSGTRSDKICPPVPQPNPTKAALHPARRSSDRDATLALLRAGLQTAQKFH